jgi:hypothetical protein
MVLLLRTAFATWARPVSPRLQWPRSRVVRKGRGTKRDTVADADVDAETDDDEIAATIAELTAGSARQLCASERTRRGEPRKATDRARGRTGLDKPTLP